MDTFFIEAMKKDLYKVLGTSSKARKLLVLGIDRTTCNQLNLTGDSKWKSRDITLATLQRKFTSVAGLGTQRSKIREMRTLVCELPDENRRMLELLIRHLVKVKAMSRVNLMKQQKLAECFGNTIMKARPGKIYPKKLDINACNKVVEMMNRNCDEISVAMRQISAAVTVEHLHPVSVLTKQVQMIAIRVITEKVNDNVQYLIILQDADACIS